jgi:hypothetical protein
MAAAAAADHSQNPVQSKDDRNCLLNQARVGATNRAPGWKVAKKCSTPAVQESKQQQAAKARKADWEATPAEQLKIQRGGAP